MKKRILSFITMLAMLVNMFAAVPAVYAASSELAAPGTNAAAFDGKKILMIGCSYTHYGATVVPHGNTATQAKRSNDVGFIYQLFKANGAEVNVTDWTFGGHNLKQIMGGNTCSNSSCSGNSINHLETLTDRDYDYVFIQDISYTSLENKLDRTDIEGKMDIYIDTVKDIMDIFTAVNPDVKFYYGLYTGLYTSTGSNSDALRISLEKNTELGCESIRLGYSYI